MQKSEIENLIATMPLDENVKLALVDDLNNKVPINTVLEKISTALGVKGKLLDENNSEAAKAYSNIIRQYNEEVKAEETEFDAKIDEIDSEAEEVDRNVSKQLDEVRIEELKESVRE